MAKITKRVVDALLPGSVLWDDELPGFGVRRRAGGRTTYFLKYRTAGGRQRWFTIGIHGPLTPDLARSRALTHKAAIAGGSDPSGDRALRRHENTIAELADRYVAEHVQTHNKPSTRREVERIVARRIKPALGAFRITDLTRADVKAWHQKMSATPYEANRALAYLSKLLSLAAYDWQMRSDNPCKGIARFRETARERFYSDDELTRIGEALVEAERECAQGPGALVLIRLLATTGMRLSEALSVSWEDVDLAARTLRLRDAKAGGRTVHLGAAAAAILDGLEPKSGFVVNGGKPDQPLTASRAENAWRRLRKRAGITGRLHDLRHTVGTLAALSGANAFAVRDLLGHKTLAMTNRYVERARDLVQATADSVSNRVGAAMTSRERGSAEIKPIAGRS
jgi:integrase